MADSVDFNNNNWAWFSGISKTGQFILCRKTAAEIALESNILNFGSIWPGDTLNLTLSINNTGLDTLFIDSLMLINNFFMYRNPLAMCCHSKKQILL
ncbi:MAG: hypothetical protein R2764_03780 [Bacteroidales bacterium]